MVELESWNHWSMMQPSIVTCLARLSMLILSRVSNGVSTICRPSSVETNETPLPPASVTTSLSSANLPGTKLRQFLPLIGLTPSAKRDGPVGEEAERVGDALGVLAAAAGDVGELALNILAVVVEVALVEYADALRLAAEVEPAPKVEILRRWRRLEAHDTASRTGRPISPTMQERV